jgi:hypothetical protein
MIALLLASLAIAYIRRHAGKGLYSLCVLALLAGLALHTDRAAYAPPSNIFDITTPDGTQVFECPPTTRLRNTSSSNVTLTVTVLGGMPATTGDCRTGHVLAPSDSCLLTCIAG